jgi:glycosyltransferase involved in cell wall biosynthesis
MVHSANNVDISVVVPVFGCATSIIELSERIKKSLIELTSNFEIIFINDRSLDNSWRIIDHIAQSDRRIKGVLLSKNFGQHAAITAGLSHSLGDWIIVMDCDLQDRPEEIPRLHKTALEGYELVVAVRKDRKDSIAKRISSRTFNFIMSRITESKKNRGVSNFGIYSRKVIDAVLEMKEQTRTFALLAEWVGFTRIEIEVEHSARKNGISAYTFSRSLGLALESAIGFSNKILRIIATFGFAISLLSFIFSAWIILRKFEDSTLQIGWTSVVASIFLTSGLIIMVIGIVGLYIAQTFEETKSRPIYLVESKININ